MADPRLIFDLAVSESEGREAEQLLKLLLRRRAYRIVTDLLDEKAAAVLQQGGIDVIAPESLTGESISLPAGPTAVMSADPGMAADIARRAGDLPVVRMR